MVFSTSMGRFTDNSVKDAAHGTSAKTAGVLSLAALAGVALLSAFRKDEDACIPDKDDVSPREMLVSFHHTQEPETPPDPGTYQDATQAIPSTSSHLIPLFPTEPSVKLSSDTSVVLVGGGVIPPEVASLIAARCTQISKLPNGGDGTLLICSYATAEPREGFARAERIFSAAGATNIAYLPPPEDPDFSIETWRSLVERASGIFFTGGDQKRIYSRLFNRNLLPELHSRIESGPCILGGTSAGTAIMSPTMIAGGPLVDPADWPDLFLHKTDLATFSHGISVIPFVTDQHFSQKKREERLSHADRKSVV